MGSILLISSVTAEEKLGYYVLTGTDGGDLLCIESP